MRHGQKNIKLILNLSIIQEKISLGWLDYRPKSIIYSEDGTDRVFRNVGI